MNKNFLNYFKEHKNILIISFTLLFIVLFFIFFIRYNSKDNKIRRNLKNVSNELNEINLSLPNGIKDLTIDTNISKDLLSNSIEKLNGLLISISETEETTTNISITKSRLESAVNSTISLYEFSLSTLSNPESIKEISDLDKLDSLRESCILTYSELTKDKLNVNFSKETINYFDNLDNYMNTLIKINRYSEFKNSQTRDFVNLLQGYKNDISYLNEDLSIAINKVREDKRDLQVIIDDIYKKEEIYNNLKENTTFISIPEGCMDIYESLTEYLNSYYAYLMSIKEAVIYEKTSKNSEELSDEINKHYKNSTSKLKDALSAYSNYESKLINF